MGVEPAKAVEAARPAPEERRAASASGAPRAPRRPSATVAPGLIELDGLGIRFGRFQVLDDLTGQFSGRCIGLLGPNGAGKTTLLHTLLGFYKPSSGTARIFGYDIKKQSKEIRQLIGYMPERDAFIAGMSGVRFVRLMAEVSGLPARRALERAHEVFFYVGLGEARYRNLETYSLGMKQLAKLAQAIVHGPRLIFLDEPTNGLDPPARVRMLRLIREIRDSGKAQIIISSHLLRDVEECCEEVLILNRGKIANYCNLEEERRSNRRFLEIETQRTEAARERAAYAEGADRSSAQESFAEALRELGCEVAVVNRRRLKAVLPPGVEVRDLYQAARLRDIQIRRLDYKRDSLEDIFMKAMGTDDGGL
ncbi:MAG TPA: ABC transporter ATP-binding protein [Thermoanaerobaculia bacterium]|nr:ABC transporter ATP-binding protein [Thermoanaerobaculia bacterium]